MTFPIFFFCMVGLYLGFWWCFSVWSADDHPMIIWWSSEDHPMIIWWSSDVYLMIIWWSFDDLPKIIWWSCLQISRRASIVRKCSHFWPIIQSTPQSLKQHMRSRPEPSKNTNIQTQIQKYKYNVCCSLRPNTQDYGSLKTSAKMGFCTRCSTALCKIQNVQPIPQLT